MESSLLLSLALSLAPGAQAAGAVELASVSSSGVQGLEPSDAPSVSADGRRIVFHSAAALVPDDQNGTDDVFLRDLAAGTTVRLSVGAAGSEAHGPSTFAVLSAPGDLCAFVSEAPDLVSPDTNGAADVFLKDLASGALQRVSEASGGAEADGPSFAPALAADGGSVAFLSLATNLDGPDANPSWDVFVRDLATGATSLVSRSSAGVQANGKCMDAALSGDGRLVAFASIANNLVPGDTNGAWDVFVRDLDSGITTRASVSPTGAEASGGSFDPAFTADGRLLVFAGEAVGLIHEEVLYYSDVFVKDLSTGSLELISQSTAGVQGDLSSGAPAVSTDGRFVAFRSRAENLVPGDGTGIWGWDVFLHDRATGVVERISTDPGGTDPDGTSSSPGVSADGRVVVFDSFAQDLVGLDANGAVQDVFACVRPTPPWADLGQGLAGAAGVPALSAEGDLAPYNVTRFEVAGAAPGAAAALVLGLEELELPWLGGVLVPYPTLVLPFTLDASGGASVEVAWPLGVPSGLLLVAQAWMADAAGPAGAAASNAVSDVAFEAP
jgi:Tol biopolymer transport system component